MWKLLPILIALPLIVALIFVIKYPKENLLFGRRWQYKNQNLEPSDAAINYTKTSAKVALIILTILLVVIVIFA